MRPTQIDLVSLLTIPVLVLVITFSLIGQQQTVANSAKATPTNQVALGIVLEWLGSINTDGTLSAHYILADDRVLSLLGLHIGIKPIIEHDAYGRPFSAWRYTGTSTFLPHGKNHILWKSPTGQQVYFENSLVKLDRYVKAENAEVWIKSHGNASFDISDSSGRVMQYKLGRLVEISHPMIGSYEISYDKSDISSVTNAKTGESIISLVSAPNGNIRKVVTRGGQNTLLEWGANKQLLKIGVNEKIIAFEYDNSLLRRIIRSGEKEDSIEWKQTPKWYMHGVAIKVPVHLYHYNQETYSLTESRPKVVICRYSSNSNLISRTTINIRNSAIIQERNDGNTQYTVSMLYK